MTAKKVSKKSTTKAIPKKKTKIEPEYHSESLASPALRKWFDSYDRNHQEKRNQICHYFGVSAITLGTLGVGSAVPLPLVGDLGLLIFLILSSWWIRMDWKISTPFCIFALGLYFIVRNFPLALNLALLFGGWGIAFFGHYVFEKNRPNLLVSVRESVTGPLLYYAKLIGAHRTTRD